MDSYIKIEDAAKAFSFYSPYRYETCLNDLISSIADGTIELADVVPVMHARWLFDAAWGESKCTHCGWYTSNVEDYKYCPNCGAKMEG